MDSSQLELFDQAFDLSNHCSSRGYWLKRQTTAGYQLTLSSLLPPIWGLVIKKLPRPPLAFHLCLTHLPTLWQPSI